MHTFGCCVQGTPVTRTCAPLSMLPPSPLRVVYALNDTVTVLPASVKVVDAPQFVFDALVPVQDSETLCDCPA